MSKMVPSLHYLPGDRYCPHHELQTVTAVLFVQIDPTQHVHLEGLAFDRKGDMYCTNIYDGILFKIDMKTKQVSEFYNFEEKGFSPVAIKFHKDGRIFVCGTDMQSEPLGVHGGIYILDADGSNPEKIIDHWNVDDMVFDSNGGFYFTSYLGNPQTREGSVQYVSPDYSTLTPVVEGLAAPNGIALSSDGTILWVTETAAGYLHRINLERPFHNTTPYKFEGFYGPDSCEIDADDNLYVAMARQGRVLIFNPYGFLIGQVITPGCEDGKLLGTTHATVRPGEKMLYFTAHDVTHDCGANILCVGSYSEGNKTGFQFQ